MVKPRPLHAIFSNEESPRNNVRVFGDGPTTIVSSHGFGCDQSVGRYVAPAFEGRYRAALFDLVKAAVRILQATITRSAARCVVYVDDILQILDEVEAPRVVFVGTRSARDRHAWAIKTRTFCGNCHDRPVTVILLTTANPGGFARAVFEELVDTFISALATYTAEACRQSR